jgi:hypothetical protein
MYLLWFMTEKQTPEAEVFKAKSKEHPNGPSEK